MYQFPLYGKRPLLRPKRALAFTLVELLVAMAILAMLALLISQMVGMTSTTSTLSNKQMDTISETRVVLDRIGADLERWIVRDDVSHGFVKASGDDTLGFYSGVESYEGTRQVAAVEYHLQQTAGGGMPKLERGVEGAGWEGGRGIAFSMPFPGVAVDRFDVLSEMVIRLEFTYLKKDGSLSNSAASGLSDVAAVVVAVAVVDANSLQRATGEDIEKLQAALADCEDGKDPVMGWQTAYSSSTFAADVPEFLKQSLRFSQRYHYVQ